MQRRNTSVTTTVDNKNQHKCRADSFFKLSAVHHQLARKSQWG